MTATGTDRTSAPPVRNVHEALTFVMRNVGAISKDRKNTTQNFEFRGIDDVYNELHHWVAEAGLIAVPKLLEHQQMEKPTNKGGVSLHHVVKVAYYWQAEDGSRQEEAAVVMGEAADTGDKGLGKAQQYAFKTFLLQSFLIPTKGDNDPDAQSVEWARPGEPASRPKVRPQERPAPEPPRGQTPPAPAKPPEPPKKQPTADEVFQFNKTAIESCKTVEELRALVCKGFKYMAVEQHGELRKLRAQRMQKLGAAAEVDPMATRLAEAYARLAKVDKDRANAIMRETIVTAERVELMELALAAAPTLQPQPTAVALQPGHGDLQ